MFVFIIRTIHDVGSKNDFSVMVEIMFCDFSDDEQPYAALFDN